MLPEIALPQVHPCDHSLLRELFQPGQDNRQVVMRARYNTDNVSHTSPLHPIKKKSFVCPLCLFLLKLELFVKRCAARGKARPAGYMVSLSLFYYRVAQKKVSFKINL